MPFLLLVWSRAFEIKQYQSTLGQTVSVKSSSGDYILGRVHWCQQVFQVSYQPMGGCQIYI
jgi:hypothetical protein